MTAGPDSTGVVGMLTGAVLSVLQQKQLLRHSVGTAASCIICVGGFAGTALASLVPV